MRRAALTALLLALPVGAGCRQLGPSRDAMVAAAVKGCQQSPGAKAENVDCACLVRESLSDMSEAELALWAREPELFDQEELTLLVVRQAIRCAKPQLVQGCLRGGGWQGACDCLADSFLEAFSGDQLMDVVERSLNGAPLPQAAVQLRTECVQKHPKPAVKRF